MGETLKTKIVILLELMLLGCAGAAATAASQGIRVDPPALEPTERHVTVETVDGVVLDAVLYSSGAPEAVIYCHRLLGGKSGEETERLRRALLGRYDLLVFDFRGHEASFGATTAGGDEILDLRAAIAFAKRSGYRSIYVVGAGMGANVAWRTAAVFRNIDGVVAISPSGFAPEISPFFVRLVSDKVLETSFGKVPLRIAANTRIGLRYAAGYPSDLSALSVPVPLLVINAEKDRLVSLKKLKVVLEDLAVPAAVTIVPGRRHAEDLITDQNLETVRAFLDRVSADAADSIAAVVAAPQDVFNADSSGISFSGDMPLPSWIVFRELQQVLPAPRLSGDVTGYSARDLKRAIEDILAIHGYARAVVSVADSVTGTPPGGITCAIAAPRIASTTIEGNNWLSDDYLKKIAALGNDYYNTYELDAAIRRLSSEPAVRHVKPVVTDRPDGNVDIRLTVTEQRPYRIMISTKFTEVDDFGGVGLTWNEFNPAGLKYEGRVMVGIADQDVLTDHRVSRGLLANRLRLSATAFDNIKSRDDLEYQLTRQEVREVGAEIDADYRVSASIGLGVGGFGKRYRSVEVTEDMPVEEGGAGGYRARMDLSGALPPGGRPRVRWRHTAEYQRVGAGGVGDFGFETLQLNLEWKTRVSAQHSLETLLRWGRISGAAPPQEQFSLGGMTSLPGYEDDAFVGTRVILAGQAIVLSARSLFDERSAWAPLGLVMLGHAGMVWGGGEHFSWEGLKMDAGFEINYLETLRAGAVWPVGGTREGSARIFVGWGAHVY